MTLKVEKISLFSLKTKYFCLFLKSLHLPRKSCEFVVWAPNGRLLYRIYAPIPKP